MGASDILTAEYFSSSIGISSIESSAIRKSASIEGKLAEFGQENVSTVKRNLLNADEILRLPSNKLLVVIRGNNPLLLDKVIYTEHKVSKKLKDSPITEYKPLWTDYSEEKEIIKDKNSKIISKKGFKFY